MPGLVPGICVWETNNESSLGKWLAAGVTEAEAP